MEQLLVNGFAKAWEDFGLNPSFTRAANAARRIKSEANYNGEKVSCEDTHVREMLNSGARNE